MPLAVGCLRRLIHIHTIGHNLTLLNVSLYITFKQMCEYIELVLDRQGKERLRNMAGCKLSVFLVALCIMMLCSGTEGWWRRRRRRRCSAVSCIWGGWSGWGGCNHPCGSSGTRARTRGIARGASCGGASCSGPSRQVQPCNRFCHNGGHPQNGYCSCSAAFRGTCCQTSEYCLNFIKYDQRKETTEGMYIV